MSNLISHAEFAKLAGTASGNLSNYIKRNKVVVAKVIDSGKEKQILIDLDNAINKEFLKQRDLIKAKKAFDTEDKEVDKKPENGKKQPKEDSYWGQTKKAEMEFKQYRSQMAKLEYEKAMGRLVPVDLVIKINCQYVQNYQMSIMQRTNLLIRDVLNELYAGNEVITKTCGKLTDIINDCSHTVAKQLEKGVKTIIEQSTNTETND